MALKDWKKTGKDVWKSVQSSDISIRIIYDDMSAVWIAFVNDFSHGEAIEFRIGSRVSTHKDALKIVNDYMKKTKGY